MITKVEHQNVAHSALTLGLQSHNRVQAHMACGSGKTFTQAFLAQELINECEYDDPVIVCFVPNRGLVRQNAKNFRKIFGDSVDYLGACSADESLTAQDDDQDDDWLLPVTTDPDEISKMARGKLRPKIIFSTYQSARDVTHKGLTADGGQMPVLLGLFDEAHRTAGDKDIDSLFAFGLFEKNFEIEKRAFFTATPRMIEPGGASPTISMDDPDLYGPVVYEYSYREAVRDKRVVDYDLHVPVIDKHELDRIMQERGVDEEGRKGLVAEMALAKIIEKTGQTKILTYHNRTKKSEMFTERLRETYEPQGFLVGHIDGTTKHKERERMFKALASGKAILNNCKALVEGVDAPGLQAIMMVDAKGSFVDLVQAVGRPSRIDPDDENKRASIIVPLIVDTSDTRSIEKQAKEQGFGPLLQVLQALSANDDGLANDIRTKSREVGRTGRLEGAEGAVGNLNVVNLGNPVSAEEMSEITNFVSMVSLMGTKDLFADRVGKLEAHLDTHGALPDSKTDKSLSSWVSSTRRLHREGRLAAKDAEMLDTVQGWSWLGPRDKEDAIADHISAFYERARRMPDRMSKDASEQGLGLRVRRAEQYFLRPYEVKIASRSKKSERDAALSTALGDRGLMFKSEEAEAPMIRGSIRRRVDVKAGDPEYEFVPKINHEDGSQNYDGLFRTGHEVSKRILGIYLNKAQRSQFDALEGANHEVTLRIERAGRHLSPFLDGRVTKWQVDEIDRGDNPDRKATAGYLVNRLKDRKVSGREPYTLTNLKAGRIKADEDATRYSDKAPKATAEHILKLAMGVRKAAAAGSLKQSDICELDSAPGFSWVDQQKPKGFLAPAVRGLVDRHGEGILNSPDSRRGDNAVANTLRAVDAIFEAEVASKGLAEDIKDLKEAGHYKVLRAYGSAQKKRATDLAQKANIEAMNSSKVRSNDP